MPVRLALFPRISGLAASASAWIEATSLAPINAASAAPVSKITSASREPRHTACRVPVSTWSIGEPTITDQPDKDDRLKADSISTPSRLVDRSTAESDRDSASSIAPVARCPTNCSGLMLRQMTRPERSTSVAMFPVPAFSRLMRASKERGRKIAEMAYWGLAPAPSGTSTQTMFGSTAPRVRSQMCDLPWASAFHISAGGGGRRERGALWQKRVHELASAAVVDDDPRVAVLERNARLLIQPRPIAR